MVDIPKPSYEALTPTPTANDIWMLYYTINMLRAILGNEVHIAKHSKRIPCFLVIIKRKQADPLKWETPLSAPIFHLPTNADIAHGVYHTLERKALYKPTVNLSYVNVSNLFLVGPFFCFLAAFVTCLKE